MSDEHEVVPGTRWFQLGDVKVFLNKALISLAISVVGALIGATGDWLGSTIKQAPLPTEIQGALYTISVWATAQVYRIVFPQAPTFTKRGKS